VTRQQVIQAKEKQVSIEAQIANHRAQIKSLEAQRYAEESQPEFFDADTQARISDYERTLAGLRKELQLASEVITPYAGEVLELKVYSGGAVSAGSPIVSIQPISPALEAIVYLPSTQAKEVTPGMEVQVSPSSVRREEFGYMVGKVTFVADYPTTAAALMRNFQNDSLVQAITQKGPVNELRVELLPDRSSVSGFKWSSGGGPPVTISSGTVCNVNIVTREQQPVSLVLPIVRKKLGLS
jgi:HlyD family secretion protein